VESKGENIYVNSTEREWR